jgi:predicted O-methyltransferase YrrM
MVLLERAFSRRPRLLDLLHRAHLVRAISQTNEIELKAIEEYATGAGTALEIGSSQGVSAARIAAAMPDSGILYCVDPWPASEGKLNACHAIFRRHISRTGVTSKIRVLQKVSSAVGGLVPSEIDFIFVDGDHSWKGIETDWCLVRQKLRFGGIVCLHDSLIPAEEPWREPESVKFYQQVVAADPEFRTIDHVHSLAVLRRLEPKIDR